MVDVGANCGLYTLIAAAKCGPFGRVLAIEPDPQMCGYIRKSLLANWVHDRVQINEVAASDVEGRVELTVLSERRGDTRIVSLASQNSIFQHTKQVASEGFALSARCRPLDEIIPANVAIKLLKIDAEGHEIEVLRGARRLFDSHCIEYLLIEVSKSYQGARAKVFLEELQRIISLSYQAHFIEQAGKLRLCPDLVAGIPNLGHNNIVFVRS